MNTKWDIKVQTCDSKTASKPLIEFLERQQRCLQISREIETTSQLAEKRADDVSEQITSAPAQTTTTDGVSRPSRDHKPTSNEKNLRKILRRESVSSDDGTRRVNPSAATMTTALTEGVPAATAPAKDGSSKPSTSQRFESDGPRNNDEDDQS